ncbi:MAG: transposase Tn3 family protein [Sphaerisporangium sp.]|nr:transposase Tn3 family protein [Sphaerisporangium sp.]
MPDGQEPAGDYGPLEAIAHNRVNLKRIETHWPDMLRVAGSLVGRHFPGDPADRVIFSRTCPQPPSSAFS